jgi:hypothetical protein
MEEKAEIGILFIHGIGEQRIGQTLTEFGEPFCQWINDWLNSTESKNNDKINSKVEIIDANLNSNEPQSCPHFYSNLKVNNLSNYEQKKWLFAESFWADSFPLPGTQEVTFWLLQIVPWTCISYATQRIIIAWHKLVNIFSIRKFYFGLIYAAIITFYIILTIPLTALALLMQLILFILILIWKIPIPIIRDYIYWTQKKISAIIGDSYVFSSSIIRREFAISKLQHDINWIKGRCQNLVIIAHSQGAALAYLTLKKNFPKNFKLFVTFGSGLNKLALFFQPSFRKKIHTVSYFTYLSVYFIALYSYFILIAPQQQRIEPNDWSGLVVIGFSLIFYISALVDSTNESTDEIKLFGEQLENGKVKWLDIFSSSDPVPNGPLFNSNQTFITSKLIWNERSIFIDHVTYTHNMEGFWPEIITSIVRNKITLLPIINDVIGSHGFLLNYRKESRRIRSFVFMFIRLLLFTSLLLVIFNDRARLLAGTGINYLYYSFYSKICFLFGIENLKATPVFSIKISGIFTIFLFYFVFFKLIRLFQNFYFKSFPESIPEKFQGLLIVGYSAKLLFIISFFLFIAYNFFLEAIHLYFSKPLNITIFIVETFSLNKVPLIYLTKNLYIDPLMVPYFIWQKNFFLLLIVFLTVAVYFVCTKKILKRLYLKHYMS